MLSSQFENIILEYKQDITVKKMGEPLVARFAQDVIRNPQQLAPATKKIVDALGKAEEGYHTTNATLLTVDNTPAEKLKVEKVRDKFKEKALILKNQLAVKVLGKLEEADPTKNKQYVQWLARTYINNDMSLEDVESTTADYLDKFHRLKVKNHLDNADIGQYKDFDTFMTALDQYPNDLIDDDAGKKKQYNADIIYDEKGVLIVRPNDKEASCRYGRGTRWCTAATRGYNYFDSYTSRGPLYMFIPRKPKHVGEKYQFHFEDNHVADEKDSYLNQAQLVQLAHDYPALKDAFQEQAEKHGLIWLQKPKRVHKGSNFDVEEYRKDNKPYYLMKPTDVDNVIYAMQKDEEGNMQVFKLSSSSYGNDELNAIQEHDLFNRYPELVTKFGVKGSNILPDPKITNTKNGASIEQHDKIIVMTDQYGHKTAIQAFLNNNSDHINIKALRTNPFKNTDKDGKPIRGNTRKFLDLNPYELTLEHPELINIYGKELEKAVQKNLRDMKIGSGPNSSKFRKKHLEDGLRHIAPFLPYKIYNKDNVVIKSHVTSKGKPIVDYVTNKADGSATIINRDMTTGEIDNITPVYTERLERISDGEPELVNGQGEVYADAREDASLQRLYSETIGRTDDDFLDFLPSVAFLEANPGLKDFYKDVNLLDPKIKDLPTFTLRDYGRIKNPEIRGSGRSYYSSITDDVKSMRNYIVAPKNAEDEESYAISWSPEQPRYLQVFHSDKSGKQTKIESALGIQHVLKLFPEVRKLHMKDYVKYLNADPERAIGGYSMYGRNTVDREGMPEWLFNPSDEVDNDRVDIKQYGPNENQTHELPTFEVRPKQDNPFGKVGDTFWIELSLKDNRGKFGKISEIRITRLSRNMHKSEPVDRYGNYDRTDPADVDSVFEPVDTKMKEQKKQLSNKEVIDFYKYYPELRLMIRDENIHPKTPHPALANKPDEEGKVDDNSVKYPNFTLENAPGTEANIQKQFIIPDRPQYEGEFYTLYTFDPLSSEAIKATGQTMFTQYGRLKVYNERGLTQLVKGEIESSNRGYYRGDMHGAMEEMQQALQGRDMGTMTPNTPAYNRLMQRMPDLNELIVEKGEEIGDFRTQNLSEDDVVELGTERIYTFKNRDGSDLYIITPVGNPLRGDHGEIQQSYNDDRTTGRLGTDIGNAYRKLASDEEDWQDEGNYWNENSFAVNFESTENNPYLQIRFYQDPFKDIIDLQLDTLDFKDDEDKEKVQQAFSSVSMAKNPEGGIQTAMENTYLGKAKKNPEVYRWLQEKAETRNAETKGIGDFINFLPITSNQLTDDQTDIPKIHGIHAVGIAKLGISNPIYIWQGRQEAFEKTDYMLNADYNRGHDRNRAYFDTMNELLNTRQNYYGGKFLTNVTIMLKPESGTKFTNTSTSRTGHQGSFMEVPNAKFINMAKKLPNSEKIISKKDLKTMGALPTQTWGPRQVAGLAPNSKLTNKGKPWIKSIQEFTMPDGIGIESHGYGVDLPHKVLPPGTAFLITLNPISGEDGPKKRKDGRLVRRQSAWGAMSSAIRHVDLPWDFTHNILDYGEKENQMLIYFANNRVAYIIDPMSSSYTKYNLTQDQKKKLFFDEEYGLFPQLKPVFDKFAKSNKWLRENQIHAIMSKIIFEGLGDKAYYELRKKKSKPNYGQLVFLNNIRLTGSYSNEQLKAMGFFMKNGSWAIQKPKFDRLVSDGELREMDVIDRPLKTGKNKIPKVGKKKVNENVWAFDAEKALELLKKPLLRGGDNEDVDLSCDMCGGHGCGEGYDIKDDLRRWKEMLEPNSDEKPEHLGIKYIKQKIQKLEALVKKNPNGIPDNIDCSAGMSKMKHREYQKIKRHDAADVLYDVIGDDGFHDDMSELDETDDVRPLIMNWLNPEWRKRARPGLPEYPLVADVDFEELYRRARKIYNPLRVVKEGIRQTKTSEFLYQKVDEVEDIKRLSGVYDKYQIPVHVEGATSASMGSNISKTASEISKIMKEKNIQPGTPEWFQLWFSKPYLTGEKPTGEKK